MPIGLVGRKCGMTRIFTDAGESVPVTVIEAPPNRVTMLKTPERDGYRAVQVTYGSKRPARVKRPEAGHFAKAGVEPGRGLWEFRLGDGEGDELEPGAELKVDLFESGQHVDVVGTSKGKGYAGTIKRHNFRAKDMSHGNSVSHRTPGSIGQTQSPGRVFPGKKMSGHMGDARVTVPNLEIVRIDAERNLVLVRGAVPGGDSGRVVLYPTKRKTRAA